MKYIVGFVLPSGARMAAANCEGSFALTPVNPDGSVYGIMAWDTREDAQKWLSEFRKHPKADKMCVELQATIIRCEEGAES